jgi:hypothetical protein
MSAPVVSITVSAEIVDLVADYEGVGSVEVNGVSSCVVTRPDGATVVFTSPRVPGQRVPS